jgi:hypothetical protein
MGIHRLPNGIVRGYGMTRLRQGFGAAGEGSSNVPMTKATRGRVRTPRAFAKQSRPVAHISHEVLWSAMRPRIALGSLTVFSAQKSSGTLTASLLNEYTDLTNPERALLSNQAAEHHGY